MEIFMNEKYYFNKTCPEKLTISFTWDDNFERHLTHIAPLFESYGIRCTFYVNPGEDVFQSNLCKRYAKISQKGFEIGSHGYSHRHFSMLSKEELLFELTKSKEAIINSIGEIPVTFAFPHHDYTNEMLKMAKSVYFETRNTLINHIRFSLKSNTTIEDIYQIINQAINDNKSIVFSGHSVYLKNDYYTDGYEPIPYKLLEKIIFFIKNNQNAFDICTFSQAAIKEYVLKNCLYNKDYYLLDKIQLLDLGKYGINVNLMNEIL